MSQRHGGVGSREVEVKYRVVRGDVLAAAARAGVDLSPPVRQDDQAYAPEGWDYGQPKTGVSFARLRTQAGKHLFTIKQPVDNELVCLEHETEVADRDEMHHALTVMGFRPTVRIVKTRRTGAWDDLTLCVDDVDGVGVFVELERLVGPGESGEAVQRQLDERARLLGVDLQPMTQTYDSVVREAHGCDAHAGV